MKELQKNNLVYAGSYNVDDINTPQVMVLDWIEPGSKVLEIGCAGGRVCKMLKEERNCITVGVEMGVILAKRAGEICDEIITGDISDAGVIERIKNGRHFPFDYVLMFDVLEHLAWPQDVLESIREKLFTQKTKLITSIPNVLVWETRREFLLGRFDYKESGNLDNGHLRFFTYKTAKELITEAGFKIEKLEVNWSFPVLGKIYGFLTTAGLKDFSNKFEKKFGRKTPALLARANKIVRWMNQKFLLKFINSIFSIPAKIFPGLFADHIIIFASPKDGK